MATTQPVEPAFTLGDRYRKARENAGLSQEELADEIGISARTVSRYETDAIKRKRRIVTNQWALRCQVPREWLDPQLPGGEQYGSSDLHDHASRCTSDLAA